MNCPNCKGFTYNVYSNNNMPYGINLKNKTINISLNYCEKCSFVFQSSAYNKTYDKNISKLYQSYNITDMYNFPNRNTNHIKALKFIEEYVNNEIDFNVLEIGSNRGDFLYILKEQFPNINIIGCEPTNFKELKIPTVNSFFNKNLFNTKFDLIILRHTLEHIKEPLIFMKELTNLLKEKGKLFIEVPNLKYSLEKGIEDFTPDHVNYFTINTLKNTINKELLKFDDKEYLYTIFSKNECNKFFYKKENIEIKFNEYKTRYNNLLLEIQKFKRIIFYGISNYYLWTFNKLKENLKDKELFYKDDYLDSDYLNGLPQITNYKSDDLVILCSSNKKIQEKMASNLPKNTIVLYPWEKIENV